MKNLLKHLIVGVILSTIFAIAAYKWFSANGVEVTKFFLNIPVGTITYILVKLWMGWVYTHFAFFGKDVIGKFIVDNVIWPIIAAGWWVVIVVVMWASSPS